MGSPGRGERRRVARAEANAAAQDPAFRQQLEAAQQQQAVQGLVQQHETAMAALGRATRELEAREQEMNRLSQMVQQLSIENNELLGDLEESDTDIGTLSDAFRLVLDDPSVLDDEDHRQQLRDVIGGINPIVPDEAETAEAGDVVDLEEGGDVENHGAAGTAIGKVVNHGAAEPALTLVEADPED